MAIAYIGCLLHGILGLLLHSLSRLQYSAEALTILYTQKKQLILNQSVREKGDYLCDAVSWLTEGQFVPVDHVDTHSIQVLNTSFA